MKCEDCKVRRCENFGGIINRIFGNTKLSDAEKYKRLAKAANRHHLNVACIDGKSGDGSDSRVLKAIDVTCFEKES